MTHRIFITGGTGYLGSYAIDHLLRHTDYPLSLLVRAKDERQATEKLWKALQLHQEPAEFWTFRDRIRFVRGDLHAPDLGLDDDDRDELVRSSESIIHIAASLNRASEKACLNTNVRGSLSVLKLARDMADDHGLRRYSTVSTVAVSGERHSEVVTEDESIDWDRKDYDPYGRTKKLCEHMTRELLPDVPLTIFRPSIVMGDTRFPETSQFDMVQATCFLADLPFVPIKPDSKLDIVNADWAGPAIAKLHVKPDPGWDCYHLSGGTASGTPEELAHTIARHLGRRPNRFIGSMEDGTGALWRGVSAFPRRNAVTGFATLMKVFWPYITYDTVFDNQRAVSDLGEAPTPFVDYFAPLYRWAKNVHFRYPYRELPERPVTVSVQREIQA